MRLLSLATVLPLLAAAQLVPDELVAKFDAMRKTWGIPGAGVSIVSGNETQLITLGNATSTTPVTEDTLFHMGSASKGLVAYALQRLMDKGCAVAGKALDWNTLVADILPSNEWNLSDQYATKHMRILDLASMMSGIPGNDFTIKDQPAPAAIKNLRNLPMSAYRQGYQYANINFTVLQRIVEVLSGKAFPAYMADVFGDWGMQGATYNLTEAVGRGLAAGHYHTRDPTACAKSVPPNLDPACVGEVNELARWVQTDSEGVAGAMGAIVPLNQIQHFQRAVLENPLEKLEVPSGTHDPFSSYAIYGVGFQSYDYQGLHIIGHSGSVPGAVSQVYHAPSAGVSVAVFANDSEWTQYLLAIMYSVFEEVLDLGKNDWATMLLKRQIDEKFPPSVEITGGGPPVTGRFCNKGYGVLDFKPADDKLVQRLPPWVSHANATIAPFVDSVLMHSVILTAVDGPFYNWTTVMDRYDPPLLAPRGYPGTAVVTDKGIGMFNYFSTAGNVPLNPPAVEDVENKAEVWFSRC